MKNNFRFDLSDRLIHFFRDVNQLGDSAIAFPEHMGWQNLSEGTRLPASFLLRAALRNGRLWATWSYRNGERTIFGPNPAVCFTDMPIAAFLEAGQMRRANGEAMSPLALVFPKEPLHQFGARPALYGLSDNIRPPAGINGGPRLFPESALAMNEQFRYISHVYGDAKTVDWTHEREWRWPYRGDYDSVDVYAEKHGGSVSNWYDIPGLDFYQYGFEGIGAIVESARQAELVVSDMLTLIDNGVAGKNTFGFVLVSDQLSSPQALRDPHRLNDEIGNSTIRLEPYFSLSASKCRDYERRFSELVSNVESQAGPASDGQYGGCWLWLHDNKAPLTRALLQTGRIIVTRDGRYLAHLHELWDARGLRERQDMTRQLAKLVWREFETSSCYYSVQGSDRPDAIPSYSDDVDYEIGFFNCSWHR